MDLLNYIEKMEKQADFKPTGITKEFYLDVIEICVDAYTMKDIENRILVYERNGVDDPHAFCRLTSAIGLLLSNNRKKGYYELWIRMMDLCCKDLPLRYGDGRIDFSVKEILLAYKAMKLRVDEDKKQQWYDNLCKIDPYKNYLYVIRSDGDVAKLHNINIYNMVGEFLRESEGMTSTEEYFEKHLPMQLDRFDGNGMYKDPNCPILYDLTTRCQIQIMLGAGYKGKFFNPLDDKLKNGGLWTLFMQSAAFEMPYGGRSNQFLFNEALISANCEFEAARYKKLGNLKLAGSFKRSAHLAALVIKRWLDAKPPRHIKNFYPVDTLYGTEDYGYYDKYMVTLGCFIYGAFMFADDTIEEFTCPAEAGGYVFSTSDDFHKIFANCCGQSIEIDTKADLHYDATGLGRYHKKGIPTELALSIPFTDYPSYTLPEGLLRENAAIGPGWYLDNNRQCYLSELSKGLKHRMEIIETGLERTRFCVHYTGEALHGCDEVIECYTIDKSGLNIYIELVKPFIRQLYFRIPIFMFNGKDRSDVSLLDKKIVAELGKNKYTVSSDGYFELESGLMGNRNGEYGVIIITSDEPVMTVHLQLD